MKRTVLIVLFWACALGGVKADELFQRANKAYITADFQQAASLFRTVVSNELSPGALHNLGNAEWKCNRTGPAILAWEQARWLDPWNANTRANLRFARHAAQLDEPNLAWYQIGSTWLPVNSWAWIASVSFWTALAMMLLPAILRWRKADWHQGLAAAGFALFLLTLPALMGVHSRSKLGVLLGKQTPLRLTPTREAQILGQLPGGEMARIERTRNDYVYIRTGNDAAGWVERSQFGLISSR